MKKLFLLLAISLSAFGQSNRVYNASTYAYTTQVNGGNPSTGSSSLSASPTAFAQGIPFSPYNTNASITINRNAANAETVTPSSVTNCFPNGAGCTLSSTFTFKHVTGESIQSGTFGLQEAINIAMASGSGTVLIDSSWQGTAGASLITAATGNVNVMIQDNRNPSGAVFYQWGGSAYAAAGGGATLPTAAGIGYPLKSIAAGTTYGAQSPIALDPRDYGADFTGQSVADATTTSGSNVITCPNSDCGFPSNIASASYIIFATAGNGSSCLDNPSITFGGALQTTVTGFTNANSITVSGTANTTGTATVCLAWFPKDSTTALNAWWLAGGCTGVYQMPPGKTLFSAPIMQFIAGCPLAVNAGLGYPGQTVKGAGLGSTFLMPAPVFTYTSILGLQASNICAIGNKNVEDSENFAVFGLGERATATMNNTCLFIVGDASRAINIDLVGWDGRGGGAGLVGAYIEGIEDTWAVGGSNYFGSIEMYMSNYGQYLLTSFTSGNNAGVTGTCGFRVTGAAQVTVIGNGIQVCSQVDSGAVMTSSGSQFLGATGDSVALYANGGRMYLLGNDTISNGGLNYAITGSAVFAQGATFSAITGIAGGFFFDNGGNSFSTVTFNGLIWPQNLSVVGIPAAAANTVLGAGWGNTPTATATAFSANSDERHFTLTITNGTAGLAQATATIVYTFPRAFQVAPGTCQANQVGGTNPVEVFLTTTAQTATSVTFTAQTLPVASATEVIAVDCQ